MGILQHKDVLPHILCSHRVAFHWFTIPTAALYHFVIRPLVFFLTVNKCQDNCFAPYYLCSCMYLLFLSRVQVISSHLMKLLRIFCIHVFLAKWLCIPMASNRPTDHPSNADYTLEIVYESTDGRLLRQQLDFVTQPTDEQFLQSLHIRDTRLLSVTYSRAYLCQIALYVRLWYYQLSVWMW